MIAGTYITAGVLLIISAVMFKAGALDATTQTIWWAVVFFFASAGASAGYLTASERSGIDPTGTSAGGTGYGSPSVPDPRLGQHDDPARRP